MISKKYLVYLDILGFKVLAQEIARKSGLPEDWCRQNMILEPVRRRVREVAKKATGSTKGINPIEGSDNYLLIFDSVQRAFEAVSELIALEIPHKDYRAIPLEIGMDVREIDEAIDLEPVSRRAIIEHLKDISSSLYFYHEYCKSKENNRIEESIKGTFALLTSEFFNNLEPLDKKYCESTSYKGKNFFTTNLERLGQKA